MNPVTLIPAVPVTPRRHCTDPQCRKCRARGRWNRRKAWRGRKSPVRRTAGRK
jgi:hypothetical protein